MAFTAALYCLSEGDSLTTGSPPNRVSLALELLIEGSSVASLSTAGSADMAPLSSAAGSWLVKTEFLRHLLALNCLALKVLSRAHQLAVRWHGFVHFYLTYQLLDGLIRLGRII